MLHIHFFFLVSRKRYVQFTQHTCFNPVLQFSLVKKVCYEMLVAKEQPVSAACACSIAMSKKRPERCNTGTRTNHDNVLIICRQSELVILVNVKFHGGVNTQLRKEIGTQSTLPFFIHMKFISRNGYMHFT